ncbi:MAG: ABC transporter ATP-binding protein, partial [Cetobacterium sp.]|uniref:ABC transporter ATP-binding protein n=1 Tax=Cetobacterium sp. TaxID=2071632 RepID=UPI002FCB9756
MEILKIENLCLNINEKKVLKNISFSINQGEIIGLIGVNGSGKTTLLKCLNRVNIPSSGLIKISGESIKNMTQKILAKKIALMSQNTNISLPFNCLEIVVLGRYPHLVKGKSYTDKDYKKSKKYMELTDTIEFKDKNISCLSGGERQRVLFSKVLAQETEIILLDEPTSSMDIYKQEQIFRICKTLSQEGKTIVTAIHDIRMAAKYCDKLLL